MEGAASGRDSGNHPTLTRRELGELLYRDQYWPWERWLRVHSPLGRRPATASLTVPGDGWAAIELVRRRCTRFLPERGRDDLVVAVIDQRTFCGSRSYGGADLALLSIRIGTPVNGSTTLELRLDYAGNRSMRRLVAMIGAVVSDPGSEPPAVEHLNRRPVEPDEFRAARSGQFGRGPRRGAYANAALTLMIVIVSFVGPSLVAWWGLVLLLATMAAWYVSASWLGVQVRRRRFDDKARHPG